MIKKLVVQNKEEFQIPQHEFFKGVEVIQSRHLPRDIFVLIEGNSFINSTMYIFKYKNGELHYHKIPPMWSNIGLPIVEDPYEKNKFYPTFTEQFKIPEMVL